MSSFDYMHVFDVYNEITEDITSIFRFVQNDKTVIMYIENKDSKKLIVDIALFAAVYYDKNSILMLSLNPQRLENGYYTYSIVLSQ